MKAFRFKKHKMDNVKINVIVIPEDQEDQIIIRAGRSYARRNLPSLPKPILPNRFFAKVIKPSYTGRVEFTFDGKIR